MSENQKTFIQIVSFLFIYLIMMFINLKGNLGYQGSFDEDYYEQVLEIISSGGHVWERYIYWAQYLSFIQSINNKLPQYLNTLSIIVIAYYIKIRYKINIKDLALFLVFMPSVFFYTDSTMRDILFYVFTFIIILVLDNNKKIYLLLIPIILLITYLFREYYAYLYVFSLVIAYLFKDKKILFAGVIVFFSIGVILFFNVSLLQVYKSYVLVEGPNKYFGLVGFRTYNLENWQILLTYFLNWLPYWFTYHLFNINSIKKIILFYESVLLLIMFIKLFRSKLELFRYNISLRFCSVLLICTFIFGSFETGEATAIRHKLVFIPALFAISFFYKKTD